MLSCLELPNGAKVQLGYGPDIAAKVINGEPLWEEEKPQDKGDDDEDAEIDEEQAKKNANKISDDEKNRLTMYGEGKYHIIPSFFRTLIFLRKQKRDFQVCFRSFGEDLD